MTTPKKRKRSDETGASLRNGPLKKKYLQSSDNGSKIIDNVDETNRNLERNSHDTNSEGNSNTRSAIRRSRNHLTDVNGQRETQFLNGSKATNAADVGIALSSSTMNSNHQRQGDVTRIPDPPGYPATPDIDTSSRRKDRIVRTVHVNGTESNIEEKNSNTVPESSFEADFERTNTERKAVVTISSWTVRFCVIFSLCFAIMSVYQSYIDSELIKGSINADLESSQRVHNHTIDTLALVRNDLQQSQEKNTQCQHRLRVVQLENENLVTDVSFLQKRLQSTIGTEDTIQASLSNAWEQIDQLHREKHHFSSSLDSCNEVKTAIEDEQQVCSDRLVELEFEGVELEEQMQLDSIKAQAQLQEKDNIQFKLHEQHDLVALLQHQLEEENGQSWYYELQIQHLESVAEDLEGLMSDLKYNNQELKKEIQRLRKQILIQNEEAVAALNAVARSATVRKAEQFTLMKSAADSRVEKVMAEAVNAIQSVLSVRSTNNDAFTTDNS